MPLRAIANSLMQQRKRNLARELQASSAPSSGRTRTSLAAARRAHRAAVPRRCDHPAAGSAAGRGHRTTCRCVLVALVVLILPVFQLDSAASLTDDWLCRPVPASASSLVAKLAAAALGSLSTSRHRHLRRGSEPRVCRCRRRCWTRCCCGTGRRCCWCRSSCSSPSSRAPSSRVSACCSPSSSACSCFPRRSCGRRGRSNRGSARTCSLAGMEWLGSLPARLVSLALVACGFWLVYWRRRLVRRARAAGAHGLRHAVLHGVADGVAALERDVRAPASVGSGTDLRTRREFSCAIRASVYPRPASPSSPRMRSSSRPRSGTASSCGTKKRSLRVSARTPSPSSPAIEPRGLPLDWRVKLNYVQADYSAAGETLYSLRPARYITDQAGDGSLRACLDAAGARGSKAAGPAASAGSHLLADAAEATRIPRAHGRKTTPFARARVLQRRGRTGRATASTSTASARPRIRRRSAPNSTRSRRVARTAARISRRLFAQWPYSQRVTLAVASPRLARHETITVIAWEVRRAISRSPGIARHSRRRSRHLSAAHRRRQRHAEIELARCRAARDVLHPGGRGRAARGAGLRRRRHAAAAACPASAPPLTATTSSPLRSRESIASSR